MRSENDLTLYVKKKDKNDFIIICLYVDDIIYTSLSVFLVDEFKSQMMNVLEMSCWKIRWPMLKRGVNWTIYNFSKTWMFEWDLLWTFDYNDNATQKQQVGFTNSLLKIQFEV